jgi:5-formyltetrahydrofolate cyclo-ligase
MPDDHASLRAAGRAARRGVDAADAARRANAACDLLASLPWWDRARRVAVTRPFDGELDTTPVADRVRARGAQVYVPVLAGDVMRFAPVDGSTTWGPNRYGIDEPVGVESVAGDDLDLVVVPAAAVDPAGNRIGMGAGWYDRTFAWLLAVDRPSSVVLVAYVHDEQVVERIEPAPWDVRVDAVVTPTRVVRVSE